MKRSGKRCGKDTIPPSIFRPESVWNKCADICLLGIGNFYPNCKIRQKTFNPLYFPRNIVAVLDNLRKPNAKPLTKSQKKGYNKRKIGKGAKRCKPLAFAFFRYFSSKQNDWERYDGIYARREIYEIDIRLFWLYGLWRQGDERTSFWRHLQNLKTHHSRRQKFKFVRRQHRSERYERMGDWTRCNPLHPLVSTDDGYHRRKTRQLHLPFLFSKMLLAPSS